MLCTLINPLILQVIDLKSNTPALHVHVVAILPSVLSSSNHHHCMFKKLTHSVDCRLLNFENNEEKRKEENEICCLFFGNMKIRKHEWSNFSIFQTWEDVCAHGEKLSLKKITDNNLVMEWNRLSASECTIFISFYLSILLSYYFLIYLFLNLLIYLFIKIFVFCLLLLYSITKRVNDSIWFKEQ